MTATLATCAICGLSQPLWRLKQERTLVAGVVLVRTICAERVACARRARMREQLGGRPWASR